MFCSRMLSHKATGDSHDSQTYSCYYHVSLCPCIVEDIYLQKQTEIKNKIEPAKQTLVYSSLLSCVGMFTNVTHA